MIMLGIFQTGVTSINYVVKVDCGNQSDYHYNQSDTQLSILPLALLPSLSRTHTRTCTHVRMHTHTHMHIHTHARIHTDTYTCSGRAVQASLSYRPRVPPPLLSSRMLPAMRASDWPVPRGAV